VSNAGVAQSVKTAALVTLDGSGSSDPDGHALSFAWTLVSKPDGSTASLTGTTSVAPTFTPDMSGTYVASLVVSDGQTNSAPATVTITVTPDQAIAFDSMPSPFPSNMPSYGFEAYALKSLGDRVTLKPGTPRILDSISVGMSSWACESGQWSTNDCVSGANSVYSHPITMNVYDAEHANLLATLTQPFSIPYRPSADPTCTGADAGKWKDATGVCKNGLAFKIAFDLHALNVTLPDTFIYEVLYNTNTQGPQPIGQPGSYDDLNVGVYFSPTIPTVGSEKDPGSVFWNGVVSTLDPAQDNANGGLMAQVQVTTP